MSAYKRVQQWSTFVRAWHLFDATWQDPMVFCHSIANVLSGKHKPIFHPDNDCGDHVIIINAAKIALFEDNWRYMHYHYHNRRPRSHRLYPYYYFHDQKPCELTRLYVQKGIPFEKNRMWRRRIRMARLHVFADDAVPADMMKNVSHQIRQHRTVPKRLEDYTDEEIEAFPKLLQLPDDFVDYNEAAYDRPFFDPSAKVPRPKGKP